MRAAVVVAAESLAQVAIGRDRVDQRLEAVVVRIHDCAQCAPGILAQVVTEMVALVVEHVEALPVAEDQIDFAGHEAAQLAVTPRHEFGLAVARADFTQAVHRDAVDREVKFHFGALIARGDVGEPQLRRVRET